MFAETIKRFSDNLDALRDFSDTLGPVLAKKHDDTLERYSEEMAPYWLAILLEHPEKAPTPELAEQFGDIRNRLPQFSPERIKRLATRCPVEITPEGGVKVTLNFEHVGKISELQRILSKSATQTRLLYESALITLVTLSEWLIAQVLRLYFEKFPGAAGASEKLYSFEDLKTFASIDDARYALIEHRVEQQMRASLEELLKFFKEKLKLSMGYLDDVKDEVKELFKRRNLIVHNGGIVNSIYLSGLPDHLRRDLKAGDELPVTREYLQAAVNLCEYSFALIAAELWKQLAAGDEERADTLISITYRHLLAERWAVAERLSFFTLNDKRVKESTRLIAQINFWQSLKWSGRYDRIRAEIEVADFSAKEERFQLAKYALMDDFDSFFRMLPKVLEHGHIEKGQLLEWPLFQVVRKRPEFQPYCTQPEKRIDEDENELHALPPPEQALQRSSEDPQSL